MMILSFSYTDRSSQLLNIYSKVIKKKPREKLKIYFVLNILETYDYKPAMNLSAGTLVKITIKQEIY